jgi:hypothetical protein
MSTTPTRTIQVRRDTAAAWADKNPTLALGEPALETDTGKQKMGNGTTPWATLPYLLDGVATLSAVTDVALRARGAAVLLGARPVSERCASTGQSQLSNGTTDVSIDSVTAHRIVGDSAEFRVPYVNWYSAGGTGAQDTGPGNPVTIRGLQLEYPQGVFYRVKFDDANACFVPDGEGVLSDVVEDLDFVPHGAVVLAHLRIEVDPGGRWINSHRVGWVPGVLPGQSAVPSLSWVTGEGGNKNSSSDLTGGALPLPNDSSAVPGPLTLLASAYTAPKPVVAMVGDSITSGRVSFRTVDQNWYSVLLSGKASLLNISKVGGISQDMAGVGARRRWPLVPAASVLINAYGDNNLNAAGQSLATLQADTIRLWRTARARGVPRVLQATLSPWTSSTDAWTTVSGQTPLSFEPTRVAFNDWLRAGAPLDPSTLNPVAGPGGGALVAGKAGHPLADVLDVADALESSRNSGRWKVPGRTGIANLNGKAMSSYTGTLQVGDAVSGAGVPAYTMVTALSGSTGTLYNSATAGTAVALTAAYTIDGVHPAVSADHLVANALNVDTVLGRTA